MKLTNTQLQNFVGRIKLTAEKKRKYTKQIQNLIDELRGKINEHTDMKVTRVIRAGSWKKGTALRPASDHPLDVDLVFFLDIDGAAAPEAESLQETMLKFLLEAYPNKKASDFTAGDKTVGLVFHGSGLEADLVPVVPLKSNPEYVWQPSKGGEGRPFVTSVDGQLKFCQDAKAAHSNYTSVVRILKKWKSYKELELSSFAIELIVAWLIQDGGAASNIEDEVIRFFEYLSRDEHCQMLFSGAVGSETGAVRGAGYLGDPTYNPNNVLGRTKADEWAEIQEAAEISWERLSTAQPAAAMGRTVQLWKQVFGPNFSIEAE